MSRNSIITIENIENYLSLFEIINKYTVLNKKGNQYIGLCPFHEERSASFIVNPDKNIYKCFGCGKGGKGIFSFLMQKEHLDYQQVIEFLKNQKYLENLNILKETKSKDIIIKKPLLYEFEDMPFNKKHHEYWNAGELSEEFITKEGDIYAVKKLAINKKVIKIKDDEIIFAYVYKNSKGLETNQYKFLSIGRNVSKENKWRTNLPNNKLWYLYKIKDNSSIFISKSNKDALINLKCGITSIATQSENDIILSQNIPILQKNYPNNEFIINFGTDDQGKNCSIKVSKEFNLKWFNTPNNVLNNNVNDPFAYVSTFGLENYKKLLKIKNFI